LSQEPEEKTENVPDLAPSKLEPARSNRSKCKTCKRAIDKDVVRIGILIEGPFGTGYLWHHLTCAAKRQFDAVEAAYAEHPKNAGFELPPLEELKKLQEEADKKRAEKQEPPYVERAATGRSKCAHCGEPIDEGAFRVCVLRSVEFYGQVRNGPIKVHAKCVKDALAAENSATEVEGFAEALRTNSRIEAADVATALKEIGSVG
jgi:poly [ADP-ribose] polymerase 1